MFVDVEVAGSPGFETRALVERDECFGSLKFLKCCHTYRVSCECEKHEDKIKV